MGNRNNIQKVLPTEKFVGAVEQDLFFQVNFDDTSRNLIQGDRSVDINLDERFNKERQSFTEYRIYGKILPIVDNWTDGLAIDTSAALSAAFSTLLFQDLYYIQPAAPPWPGYPQFNEFDFKRNDVDEIVSTKTNWSMYVTYPSECDMDEDMSFQLDETGIDTITYTASDGIAFYVTNVIEAGRNITRFTCSSPHGLKKREFVEITIDGGINAGGTYQTFPILNFGDGTRGSKEKVFNLSIPVGTYTPGTPIQIDPVIDPMGTMKRVINPNIPNSKSRYYVRQNKVLTKLSDYVLDNCGFEEGIFPDEKQVDRITPLAQCRVSVKKSYPTYLYNFTKDIDVERLRDNLGRPLTTLFVSVFLKNDLGYFNYPPERGWEWNFPYSFVDNSVSGTFVRGTALDPQPVSANIVDAVPGGILTRGKELRVGDTLRGDFCEYNEYEITERVVDGIVHRFDWNPQVFIHPLTGQTTNEGYIYRPHYDVPIRVFSNYIEYGDPQEVSNVPEWAEYWEPTKEWRWRDLWDIGFFDEGNGVDYPFLNGTQYPKRIIKFYVQRQNRSLSDITGNDGSGIIDELIIDGCE